MSMHIAETTPGWDKALIQAMAECLADRENPEASATAEWLRAHENEASVWSAIDRLFGDLQQLHAADCMTAAGRKSAKQQPEPFALNVHAPDPESHLVRWEIDSDEGISPARAAADAWQSNFHRGLDQPGPGDACVLTVVNTAGQSVEIDLSDEQFAYLFD